MKKVLLCAALIGLIHVEGRTDEATPVTPEQRQAAAAKAVAWLDDHLLSLPEVQGTPRKPFTFATAGLVYLMASPTRTGETPLPRIVDYLGRWLRQLAERVKDPEELPPQMGAFGSFYAIQYTWPVAQSILFFAELRERGLYGKEARRALATCVEILAAAQDENGGWGHHQVAPRDSSTDTRKNRWPSGFADAAKGYPSTIVASSSTVAAALGVLDACRGKDDVPGLEAARRYFRTAQLDNGNFPYDPSQRSSHRSMVGVSLTGSALLAMYWLGFPDTDPRVKLSLDFVNEHFDYLAEAHGSPALNLMQGAWALKLLDAESWRRFQAEYYPRLLAHQGEEGDLTCICGKKAFATTCDSERLGGSFMSVIDEAYVTSLHAFILLLEEDRLLIAKKKPRAAPGSAQTTPSSRRHR